jgi:putative oxidoreductase
MITHGVPKLEKLIAGDFKFADPIGLGSRTSLILTVIAEVLCPAFNSIGFATRLATIPLIII